MILRKLFRLVRPFLSTETEDRLRAMRRGAFARLGYHDDQWIRIVRRAEWHGFLGAEAKRSPDILEISPGHESPWQKYATGSYTSIEFPGFDITRQALARKFDIIIAEEVFEHLNDPDSAARHVHAMLRPGGVFLVSVPFLVRLHGPPEYGDFHRWSPEGLRVFLRAQGFSTVHTKSWGNLDAAIANLKGWTRYGWGRNLENDPKLPVAVWAYARL